MQHELNLVPFESDPIDCSKSCKMAQALEPEPGHPPTAKGSSEVNDSLRWAALAPRTAIGQKNSIRQADKCCSPMTSHHLGSHVRKI